MTPYTDSELSNVSPEYQAHLKAIAGRAAAIRQLRSDFDKLTYEQQWDVLNAEYFDPDMLREIQAETSQ